MMSRSPYPPIVEITRGRTAESVHSGAIIVINSQGKPIASYGQPNTLSFMRSSAKPFQALPLIEARGDITFKLTQAEIALLCSSHSGTNEHISLLETIQTKIGIEEADLSCGVHPPLDKPTAHAMYKHEQKPTQNHNNCSGKHTGMLAYANLLGVSLKNYIKPNHPVQIELLRKMSEICDLEVDEIALGTDGCSVPTYALPMRNAALAYARLCDPNGLSEPCAVACRTIVSAMTAYPEMVAGPGRFDTRLMEVTQGRIVAKGGSEGYQGLGLLPGVLNSSPAGVGIAIKIADGDRAGRARSAVTLEVLRQLGVLSDEEVQNLSEFGPIRPIHNWRKIVVGEVRPCFSIQME
jgi:L-asparaginase II